MSDSSKLQQARETVARHGQEHLLAFHGELPPADQDALVDQILSVDFATVTSLFRDLVKGAKDGKDGNGGAFPAGPEVPVEPLSARAWGDFPIAERAAMANQGMRALREGKVAAFLVAGGQGTRLGHDGPKGVFDIGLPSRKTLFQLQAERLLRLSRQAGKAIPWYIMTSEENHSETVAFFKDRRSFGLPERDIVFFKQAQLPLVDGEGRILLAGKGRLSLGPNGNGGCFLALKESGALEDMKRRGVEQVFFYSVDNALVKVCDPAFVGFAMASGLPAASKAVVKAGPGEKVGVLCSRGGRPAVIEYSEMTPEMLDARDGSGRLRFESANIAIHLFTRSFLERSAGAALPYHVAHKKIAHIGADGSLVTPTSPNAYKFELFMFDLFPLAEGMAGLLVERAEEFAPVKNKDGADSPATARELVLGLHRRWALAAGLSEEELRNKTVEISPLTSFSGEGVNPAVIRSQLGNPIVHV